MQSDIFKCPCCFISYDLDFYLPKIIISCDHYLCLKCLRNVFLNGPLNGFACPICKENFPSTIVTPEAFPTDFSVLQIIRNRTKIGECAKHGKKQSLYCMTEQMFICKYCVQFEDHKGHDYHHVKVLMDNTLRKKRRLEKLLEESINARMKIEEEMDGKFGQIKEFIKNQFFEMRMVLHLREGEIVKNVENVYNSGKEAIVSGYNENKKKWEAQIADISQTDFDFQAITFMKEEHDNNDYESLICGTKKDIERICIDTQGILGKFLKTMDLLSLYPTAKNEVSTQTSQVAMISEITQTIERLTLCGSGGKKFLFKP